MKRNGNRSWAHCSSPGRCETNTSSNNKMEVDIFDFFLIFSLYLTRKVSYCYFRGLVHPELEGNFFFFIFGKWQIILNLPAWVNTTRGKWENMRNCFVILVTQSVLCPVCFYPVPIYRSSIRTRTLSWHVESISVESTEALLQPVKNDCAAHLSEIGHFIASQSLSWCPWHLLTKTSTEPTWIRFSPDSHLDFALPIMLHISGLGPTSLHHFCSIHNQLMVSVGVTLSLQVSFAGLESTYTKWLFAK